MARHYSTTDFFRQMPNALLARYFQERELFDELDFSVRKETKPGALFDAWLTLPDDQRNTLDAQFREIFEMSCEKGFLAIIDEAGWQLRETSEDTTPFIETLSALPDHYHRAGQKLVQKQGTDHLVRKLTLGLDSINGETSPQ